MRNPCRGCPNRSAVCHGECVAYLDWTRERQRYDAARALDREVRNAAAESIVRRGGTRTWK